MALYFRPTAIDLLIADAGKGRERLSWQPMITFKDLVSIMVDAELKAVGFEPIGEGNKILRAKCGSWHQWSNGVTQTLEVTAGRSLD